MRYLVFDSKIEGHHLEYIHHLYDKARTMTNDDFVFFLNEKFMTIKDKMAWQEASNVRFVFLSKEDQRKAGNAYLLVAAWHQSWMVKRITKREDRQGMADNVYTSNAILTHSHE